MKRTILIALACLGAGMAQAQKASLPKSTSMRTLAEARPIQAWTVFCERYAAECAVDPAQPAKLALTEATWRTAAEVNRDVNRRIAQVTDIEHHGKPDVWDLAEDGKGDADDMQLLKRRILVGKGLPRRAMRIAIVMDEKGEGHPVLVMVTDKGDYVLDSKTDLIEPWGMTGYVYIKRESQDVIGWVSLGGVTH